MVPNGWEVKKLEDLCAPDAPITYGVLKPGEYCSNGIPLLQIKDLSNGQVSSQDLHLISKELDEEYKRSRILKNDILISLVGTIGRVAKFELSTPANIHRNLGRVRTDYHEFIFHFLNSDVALKLMGDSSSGSSQSALNLSTLRAMKVPFPPFKEQQKIAQILSTWDQAISATEKLLENSQQQKKALMQQLLTGKKRLLDENGERFSGDWNKVSIASTFKLITDYVASGSFATLKENVVVSEQVGFAHYVRQTDLAANFKNSTLKWVDEESYNFLKKSNLYQGDILFTNIGDLGKVYYMPALDKPATVAPNLVVLRVNTTNYSKFIYYLLASEVGQREVNKIKSGTGLPKISKTEFKTMLFNIPPFEEQKRIAAIISTADSEIEVLHRKLDCLKQEKKALMQQLLTGKKRVKVAA